MFDVFKSLIDEALKKSYNDFNQGVRKRVPMIFYGLPESERYGTSILVKRSESMTTPQIPRRHHTWFDDIAKKKARDAINKPSKPTNLQEAKFDLDGISDQLSMLRKIESNLIVDLDDIRTVIKAAESKLTEADELYRQMEAESNAKDPG